MYKFKKDIMKVPCYVWSEKGSIEQGAIDQIKNASTLPFVFHHTALMADAHRGYGVSIGSVVALKNVVCPSMVGVDIGCGMCAVKTSLTKIDPKTLKKIIKEIKKVIPTGYKKHEEEQSTKLMPLPRDIKYMSHKKQPSSYKYPIVHAEYNNALMSLGTLGGGNHFIEIQEGSDNHIWVMIHSGSRNLGFKVANYYNKLAVELNKKWHSKVLKEWELAFLPLDSEEGQDYLREMNYCIDFAFANRKVMMDKVKDIFNNTKLKDKNGKSCYGVDFEPMINIPHNYAQIENHFEENVMVHRKGATQAYLTQKGIIPGSQGTKSYIVQGRGNQESFESCSHGAGRKISRKKAIETLDLNTEIKKLDEQGIIHNIKNKKQLDEAMSCYKDINEVIKNQKDLIEVLIELTPLGVIKG